MPKLSFLFLWAFIGLASCNDYQPKNDVEKALLSLIEDSLHMRGVTYFSFYKIDTVVHRKQYYEDTLAQIFPGSKDYVYTYDSVEARYDTIKMLLDSIEAIEEKEKFLYTKDRDRYKALSALTLKLLDESSAISDKTRYLYPLMQDYKMVLESGKDSLVTIEGECDFARDEKSRHLKFVVAADDKRVLWYLDVDAALQKANQMLMERGVIPPQ